MTSSPQAVSVAVDGGRLHAACWGEGPTTVLGIHGITASSVSLAPVAEHLPAEAYRLLAPDLRGRGASNELPGPFGLASHAADCARLLEEAGSGPAVVVGESMGGYVAVLLAAARPDLVERLVLVDGGIPLPLPDGVDPATLAEAVLGPALARLSMVFESRPAYLEFWRAHPALGEDWNAHVEAYLDYDLVETVGGFRSRVSEEAVRADSIQTLIDADDIEKALASLTCPIHLIRAPRNLLNQPTPLIPDEAVADWRSRLAQLEAETVEDTNHYTVMFGARGAAVVARAVKAWP